MWPKTISISKRKQRNKNKDTNTSVRFKKRKSIKEKIKKTANDSIIQIIFLLKKPPAFSVEEKLFIVTSPAATIGRIKKTSIQSILLRAFSAINYFYCNLTEKISYMGIISLATTAPENGSGQVKLISADSSGTSWFK